MGRRSKKDRPPAVIQAVVAENVEQLRDQIFKDLPNETARNRALAKAADTTLSQIQRICRQTSAPGVDIIERVAKALRVRPQDIVTPYYAAGSPALDPSTPRKAKKQKQGAR